jgi:hypothetical protein
MLELTNRENYNPGLGLALTSKAPLVGASVSTALMVAAPFTGPAAPFVLAVGAIAGPIISLFQGCGQTCVQATQYADQAAQALGQIVNTYFAQPTPRLKSTQVAALQAIDQIMQALHDACSNPALGAAGQRCISERLVRGGSAPWCPTGTGCDWYALFRDPVAGDTNLIDDSAVSAVGVSDNLLSSLPGLPNLPISLPSGSGMILLVVALVVGGIYLAQR